MLNSFDMLIYAPTTKKIVCSFELFLFSCVLISVYEVIVRSSSAVVFIDAYYSCGPLSRSISEWLGETNSSTLSISRIGSKQLYSTDQNANPAFVLFYLGVSPYLYQEYHGNCTPSYELLIQWYFSPSLFIPRFRVAATGVPISESWCVKSILLATLLLGS